MRNPLLATLLAALLCAACAAPATAPPQSLADDIANALRSRQLVLLGEVHDNRAQHAARAAALAALLKSGARPALLMEQFDRERQPDIARARAAPGADAASVIAAAVPAGGGGWDWSLYEPYVALALQHGLPLVAANVSRTDARRISADGLAAHGFDAAVPRDVLDAQVQAIVASHCGHVDLPRAEQMALAQIARDQFMARQIAAHADGSVLLLAGNGHVRRDIGVPRWLAPALRARSLVIGLAESPDAASGGGSPAFDRQLATPAQPRPDPCEGMRRP